MTYGQYERPPFGTQPQATGLGGSETNGGYGTPDFGPATAPQSYQTGAESIGSQEHGGAHFIDAGTTDYTDPFAILGGTPGSQKTGSTGTALSSGSPAGIGDYDGAQTGVGYGNVTRPNAHGKGRI